MRTTDQDKREQTGPHADAPASMAASAPSPTPASAPSSASATATALSPARARLCVALLVLLGFALGCSEFIVIGVEPEIAETFGVSLARVGQLISLFSIAYAILTPILAITTGRFRRYQLLVVYAVVFCIANAVMAIAPTFETLLASRILMGAVSGALLAVGVTYIPELVGPTRMSMTISVVYAAFSVAMVLSTSAGKIIASTVGWEFAMMGTLVMAIVVSVALLLVMPRTGATDEPATMREQAALLGEPQILTGMAIFVFGVGSVYVFYGYVTPYLEDVLGMSSLGASGVLMGYGAACFFSNLLSGWVDARFGMRALLASFPVQAALLLALYLTGSAMPAALVPVLLIGVTMYVVSVPCISLFMRVARRRHPKALTLASSLEPMSFNCGIAFGTAVGGAVVSGPGMLLVGLVGAALSLVASLLVGVTLRLDRRRAEGGGGVAPGRGPCRVSRAMLSCVETFPHQTGRGLRACPSCFSSSSTWPSWAWASRTRSLARRGPPCMSTLASPSRGAAWSRWSPAAGPSSPAFARPRSSTALEPGA